MGLHLSRPCPGYLFSAGVLLPSWILRWCELFLWKSDDIRCRWIFPLRFLSNGVLWPSRCGNVVSSLGLHYRDEPAADIRHVWQLCASRHVHSGRIKCVYAFKNYFAPLWSQVHTNLRNHGNSLHDHIHFWSRDPRHIHRMDRHHLRT